MTTRISFNKKGQETSRQEIIDREIERTLVASTAHVSEEEMNLITTEDYGSPYAVTPYEEGCYIYLGETAEDKNKLAAHSLEFARLVEIARQQNCSYLRLDGDGPVYKDLKTFNW